MAKSLSYAEFSALSLDAKRAAQSALGDSWALKAGIWAELPARLAPAEKHGGMTVRDPRVQKLPVAKFWRDGVLPRELRLA